MTDAAVTHPRLHHANLKTTRLQEMIDWYGEVVGTKVVVQSEEFHANSIGHFLDAEKVARAAAGGEPFAEIHRKAMADELAPAQLPVEIPRASQ